MRTIDECKRLLQYRCTKAGFNGNLSPNDFNLIFPSAEQRYYNKLYKNYGVDQSNTEALSVYKSDPLPITIPNTGQYIKPEGVLHIDSIRSASQDPIKRVDDDRLGDHLKSSYDAPTALFPIYTEYSTYLQFYPVTLGSALFVYLKNLIPSYWAYTLVGNRPVYDEVTSIQPKWNDDDIDVIIYMCMSDIGISMRDQEVQQMAERKIQTEQ